MKVTVCIGSSCHIKGSRQVVEQLQQLIAENHLGEKVELKLYAPKNGSKAYTGSLQGLSDEGKVIIDINGESVDFDKKEISKMHTVFDF